MTFLDTSRTVSNANFAQRAGACVDICLYYGHKADDSSLMVKGGFKKACKLLKAICQNPK